MVIIWSIPARHDLRMVHEYIARDSKRYADRVAQAIIDKVETIPELPRTGHIVAEIGEEQLREVSVYSYRIMYEIMEDCLYVHGVIHKRRNFKAEDLER